MGAAFDQVVHARLADVGALGGLGLGDTGFVDDLADVDDQVSAQQQFCASDSGKPRSRKTLSLPAEI